MLELQWIFLWVVAAIAVEHYPLGVNFGMKYVTAAYSTISNETIIVARIEGSLDYQNHMARLVSDSRERVVRFKKVYLREGDGLVPAPERYHGYNEDHEKIIHDTLRQVIAASSEKQGHPVEVAATSTPEGLDLMAWQHLLNTIVRTEGVDYEIMWQLIGNVNAARLAYNLTTPDNLGHPEPVDLGISDGNNVVLVDYNSNALDFWSADVDVWDDLVSTNDHPEYVAHHPELGLSKISLADGADQIQQAMTRYFSTLASGELGPYVRAVMLGGEGSPEEMDRIRGMLLEALPAEYKPLFRNQIDPLYVFAIGAAQRARDFVLRRANGDFVEHDEL